MDLKNKLYFGDCLEVLKDLHDQNKIGFIDLVYIDPPFNSKRNYNILFEEADLSDTKAQREAFADTWSNISYKDTLNNIRELDLDLFNFLSVLDQIRISKSAISYLTTMAMRIYYIHKVIKETGSFFLHCDPTMSHYLKLICDLIFGEKNFKNEIIWKRTNAKGLASTKLPQDHDTIFYYSKSEKSFWNPIFLDHDEKYLTTFYKYIEPGTGRRYRLADLTNPNKDRPNLTYEFLGIKRVWRWTRERMEEAYKDGIIVQTKPSTVPQMKRYLDEQEGTSLDDLWVDISTNKLGKNERLGYPTQKPLELMERILSMSSKEGDLIADFFCGCGTTVSAAQKLDRKWIGVDISHLSIGLIERRLIDTYGPSIKGTYEIHGFPKDIDSARQLATGTDKSRFEFQKWIIEAELGGICNPKKTADGGWDGHLTFDMQGVKKVVLIEVKSGNVNVKNVREFIQVVRKQNADIGVFVCFEEQITKPMLIAAKDEGYFEAQYYGDRYDKMQILSVQNILADKGINIPDSRLLTFKTAIRDYSQKDLVQSKLDI